MLKEKVYNIEQQNNIDEIDKILDKENEYVSIEPSSNKIFQFNISKKIEVVEKTYNGKPFKQIRFRVIEQNSDHKEKSFDVGKKSARLIIAKLKDGHTLLKIERIGSGIDTLYIPTLVISNIQ